MPEWVRLCLGVLFAISFGAVCRLLRVPVPAPPAIYGALLVVATTAGYLLADRFVR